MLKRENRLKKHYQYKYVYREGTKLHGRSMSLLFVSSRTKQAKIGFTITKKIGKAVRRNLVRRRLREIIKRQLPYLKQNYNIIIVAHENILSCSFAELEQELKSLLEKGNLFK